MKLFLELLNLTGLLQPPSGGCVLKRHYRLKRLLAIYPAAFGRLCVETFIFIFIRWIIIPAAFGRLCVETRFLQVSSRLLRQPPSGGCVLKPVGSAVITHGHIQPPSGGCVLKRHINCNGAQPHSQPPSGGCVLKQCCTAKMNKPFSSRLRAAVC